MLNDEQMPPDMRAKLRANPPDWLLALVRDTVRQKMPGMVVDARAMVRRILDDPNAEQLLAEMLHNRGRSLPASYH